MSETPGRYTFVIDTPDEFAANELIEAAFDQLALAASKLHFKNVEIRWSEAVRPILQQQGTFDHSYEAMLPYTRAQFSSTFEVIELGHPKRLKLLVTIHSYEPVHLQTMV